MSIDNIAETPMIPANMADMLSVVKDVFQPAQGNCGYATPHPVFAAYDNGIALFAYETVRSTPKARRFTCVAYGLGVFHAVSAHEAMAMGLSKARTSFAHEATRRMTQTEFNALRQVSFIPPEPEVELPLAA